MPSFISALAFMNEKDKISSQDRKFTSVKHTLPTFSWVNICEKPEVNNRPVHFHTSMNNVCHVLA